MLNQAIPAYDAYADSAYRGFSRPSWARHLEGGSLLVCDTGHDRVVEIGPAGDVVWQYPGVRLTRALYRSGLATTDGTAVVTGTGTLWASIASPGDRFRVEAPGNTNWYTVASVDRDDQITLTTNYGDPGGTDAPYTLVHIQREATPEVDQHDAEFKR